MGTICSVEFTMQNLICADGHRSAVSVWSRRASFVKKIKSKLGLATGAPCHQAGTGTRQLKEVGPVTLQTKSELGSSRALSRLADISPDSIPMCVQGAAKVVLMERLLQPDPKRWEPVSGRYKLSDNAWGRAVKRSN